MKHEFQPGHLIPTHCRVYIEREGFCGLPASHDLHMPESEGEMSQSSEQGALLPCPFAHIVKMDYRPPYLTNEMSEDGNFCVYCPMCSAATGFHDFPETAVRYWNARTRSDICASLVEALKETALHFHMAHRHDITISPFESCEHRICIAARAALAQVKTDDK